MKNANAHGLEAPLILRPTDSSSAVVIWLHGLGADGHDFFPVGEWLHREFPELRRGLKFIFPHAPFRPITLNGGAVMRGWYDIDDLALHREDEVGVRESAAYVASLIEAEHQAGIPYDRICLAGFSQGGAIALFAGLTSSVTLGGVLALSTYVPVAHVFEKLVTVATQKTPLLMVHGSQDTVISLAIAERSRDLLQRQHYTPEFSVYPMGHTVCEQEIHQIGDFLFSNFFE